MITMETTQTIPDSAMPDPNNSILYMNLRVYKDGRIERKFKRKGWKEIPQNDNAGEGYNAIRIPNKVAYRHRVVMAAHNSAFDINNRKHLIDHINGDKLDNSFDNLRVVSNQGNQFNRHNVRGYTWNKQTGKWKSQIQISKKNKFLGYFDTEEAAKAAYIAGKEKYHVIEELC